ncbi:ABC transporter permease [Niallia sp. 01092]|uniref:ABC transporter permease n=1 Tax=unclassified Niallia TaxID=2837522 RepID=UPI003FD0F528
MIQLVRNEWMKIWKRPATIVMALILLLIVAVAGGIVKYQDSGLTVPDNDNWKHGLELENKRLKEELKNEELPAGTENFNKRTIAVNEYRIAHDISTNADYSVWNFVADGSKFIILAGLFTIIIAAGIVANEFNWGTVKLLLIRPISRAKLLLSKYITVVLFGCFMLVLLFGFSFILGALLFGFPEQAYPYLNYYDGVVKEQNIVVHLLIFYGLNSIGVLMLTTMAFMISTVFRNSSLAIGISIFLMFMGTTVTFMLANRFEWAKYILFANTDLTQYFEGTPIVRGMTLNFSIMMLVIYFLLFHILAFYVFKKRDVAG